MQAPAIRHAAALLFLCGPCLAACGRDRPAGDGPDSTERDRLSPLAADCRLLTLSMAAGEPARRAAEPLLAAPPPATTMAAALRAMALARLDPRAHRRRLEALARDLVSSQSLDGGWSYAIARGPAAAAATFNSRNCVAQLAALGLDACRQAGIEVDPSVLERARVFWLKERNEDGGWGCCGAKGSCGSMTAGIVVALFGLDRGLGLDPLDDPAVRSGLGWIRDRFDLSDNPGLSGRWRCYWLWSLLLLDPFLPEPLRPAPSWRPAVRRAAADAARSDGQECCPGVEPEIRRAFHDLLRRTAE